MRAIISAIISACKTAFGIGAALLSWPLRMLFGFNGRGRSEPLPEVAPALDEVPDAPVDNTALYQRVAIALQTWAAESILADQLQPTPTTWPRSVRSWTQGLDRDELFAIIDAPEYAVIAHVSETFAMPGVRKLQPLRAHTWKRQEPMDPCRLASTGFAAASIAAACER
ncbi:hypothetical protein JQ580_33405 [Bradyrhizobium japonicum]|uniref:hypothetical protein n=1 Tax=Bradyrhizobium japonicum TaxID=375 RepID=UPI001BAD428B|nr:hypothetical protein [Bradyrhizobium japonicum]MBR0995613.1 hypothetical protein [Bradyrhizobium japonicum]